MAGQIGLEPTLAEYIATMVDVFRGVRRVLRDDGTLWLNIGDSYAGGNGSSGRTKEGFNERYFGRSAGETDKQGETASHVPQRKAESGLKPKDLMMVPARLAIALQDDGWYLRSDIIWAKPNPMPESVRDRPTSSHEHIFLLTKQARYFYDADAVAEPSTVTEPGRSWDERKQLGEVMRRESDPSLTNSHIPVGGNGVTRNQRNVWTITTHGFPEAHFATFPPEIPRRCIKAGSREGDTILDPFGGAMTTMLEAERLNRHGIAIELNPEYAEIGRKRLYNDAPLLADIA